MKTIVWPAHTEKLNMKPCKNIVCQPVHFFGEHFTATFFYLLLYVHQKALTGNHMVTSISQLTAFKVTHKLRKKNTQ